MQHPVAADTLKRFWKAGPMFLRLTRIPTPSNTLTRNWRASANVSQCDRPISDVHFAFSTNLEFAQSAVRFLISVFRPGNSKMHTAGSASLGAVLFICEWIRGLN